MSHRASVTVTTVGLIPGKVRFGDACLDEVEATVAGATDDSGLLATAPFEWISIVILIGANASEPKLRRIHPKHRDLPISIEIPMTSVRAKSQSVTCSVLRNAAAKCVVSAVTRYALGDDASRERLATALAQGRSSGDDQAGSPPVDVR
jgi:hypothetical protein